MSHPKSDLWDKIKLASMQDVEYVKMLSEIQNSVINLNTTYFKIDQRGLIWIKDILYMPNNLEIKLFILNEMHKPPFARHSIYQKMLTTLRKLFLWPGLKIDFVDYLSKCLEYQQVKEKTSTSRCLVSSFTHHSIEVGGYFLRFYHMFT